MRDVTVKTSEEEIVTDLCIVGAGPAGISIARELDGGGIRVCLLESGGPDIERRVQQQSKGESDGHPIHLLNRSRVRAFGGTLRHPRILNGGWAARPLDPIDFEARPGLPNSGWPFDREHMIPYYARAQRACGLPPCDFAAGRWSDESAQDAPPIAGNEVEGTLFQFSTVDFQDTRRTLAASSNVRLLLRCRATEITADPNGRRIDTITAVRDDRSRVVVRPRLVVFATGGIENARLLLAADGGRGLGNEHDVVGRYFAERLSLPVGYVVPSGANSVDGARFFERRDEMSGAVRVTDKIQRDQGLLNCSFSLTPRPAAVTADAVRSLSDLRKAMIRRPLVDGLGKRFRRVVTGVDDLADLATSAVVSRPRVLMLRTQGEQAPNRESRVSLGSRRDDLGIPVPRVTWRTADADHQSIRTSVDIVDAALRASGFGSVKGTFGDDLDDPTPLVEGNHHHLGSTRMHVDPRMGVVDANCRVHSVENLYIAGSSVFPTYGLSNPTLTIVALALRLADHLRDPLRHR